MSKQQQSKDTYVLLVGINDYPSPVSTLNGCVNDVERIEKYLLDSFSSKEPQSSTVFGNDKKGGSISIRHFGNLHLLKLLDHQATYNNITKAFNEFLTQANKASDVVWYHFSGHGSEQLTAQEFIDEGIEATGKDQTTVCFYEEEADGYLHLADKEMAVWLHKVASVSKDGPPHMVVSLDCCHSGSGTRDFLLDDEIRSRKFDTTRAGGENIKEAQRSLASYADGFYTKRKASKHAEGIKPPVARHVLLSACESVQLAGDKADGGIFSSALLKSLEGVNGQVNYADLYVRTRASIRQDGAEQNPRFQTVDNFNAYSRFLDGEANGMPRLYPVTMDDGEWHVACGAIHGIPVKSDRPVTITIKEEKIVGGKPKLSKVATANLTGVGAHESTFEITDGGPLKKEDGKHYKAELGVLPIPPAMVYIHGHAAAVEELKTKWDESKNIQYVEDKKEIDGVPYEVEAFEDRFVVKDHQRAKTVTWPRNDKNGAEVPIDSLGKMVVWERTILLNNENSKIKNWTDFKIEVSGPNGIIKIDQVDEEGKITKVDAIQQADTLIEVDKVQMHILDGGTGAAFDTIWTVKNMAQDLHAYILLLKSDYSISHIGLDVRPFRKSEHEGKAEVSFRLNPEFGWGMSNNEKEAFCYFKLIVSTEELVIEQLLQEGLKGGMRDFIFRKSEAFRVKNEWYTFTYKVSLRKD